MHYTYNDFILKQLIGYYSLKYMYYLQDTIVYNSYLKLSLLVVSAHWLWLLNRHPRTAICYTVVLVNNWDISTFYILYILYMQAFYQSHKGEPVINHRYDIWSGSVMMMNVLIGREGNRGPHNQVCTIYVI